MILLPNTSRPPRDDEICKPEFHLAEQRPSGRETPGADLWPAGMLSKAEPHSSRPLEHLSSCDSDIQSEFRIAFQEGWGDPGTFYQFEQPPDCDFQQYGSVDCFPPGMETKPYLGELDREAELPVGFHLPAIAHCPAEGNYAFGLGEGQGEGQQLEVLHAQACPVDFEGGEECGGTPCSLKAETFSLDASHVRVDTTMDGLIENIMQRHSPYSPRKHPLFSLPPPGFDPMDALPIPELPLELPRTLEQPPLDPLGPLTTSEEQPLSIPGEPMSTPEEPRQVDDPGEAMEELPQLRCEAEEGPQEPSRTRSKRPRKAKAEAVPLSTPGRKGSRKPLLPSPDPHCEEDSEEEDGISDCMEKRVVILTASGRRANQLLLLEEDLRPDPPALESNNRCKNHKPWTIEETTALVWGVEKIGGGKWAEIKKLDCSETACLQRRTAVDLKDKWRNLQNAINRSPGDKKKGELSKELLERIRNMRESCNTKARGESRKSPAARHSRKLRRSSASRGARLSRQNSQEWLP